MAVLFYHQGDTAPMWIEPLRQAAPELEFRVWPDVGDPDEIDFAIVWHHEPGTLVQFRKLKAILSLGAGVDHVVRDADLPDVPVGRIVDERLTAGMSEYAVLHVLWQFREMPLLAAQQAEHRWQYREPPDAQSTTVGILGLGTIGRDIARKLAVFDFRIAGWSRTAKAVDGIACYHGADGLTPFLNACRFLVCVLPLTPETRGIVNRDTLAALPAGAHVINIGRGPLVVDDDLLAALDSGHIAGATLDVFSQEPLPADHRYWSHPRVVVTPHNAGDSLPEFVVPQILANIRAALDGRPLLNPVDRRRGY